MPHFLSPQVDDPRDTLAKFRRFELEAVLRAEGIAHESGIPAILARELLRRKGVKADNYLDGQNFSLSLRKVTKTVPNGEILPKRPRGRPRKLR